MIQPNVIVYESRPEDLATRKAVSVLELPVDRYTSDTDRCIVDQIRSQPKPNDIVTHTISPFKTDINQIVQLIGSFCKKNSIEEIGKTITSIHNTLNDKDIPERKNWIRLLTGIHPELDKQIKSLGYWSMPYSEVIGTNTILFYAGPDAVDIFYWAKQPEHFNNEVGQTTNASCSYIRESIRQKLDSAAVELIQNANFETTKYMRRNLIWESTITTAKDTGAETVQQRPIMPTTSTINHGASLNNDWYHGTYRVKTTRAECKTSIINRLQSGGYKVDSLVNHLSPLINSCDALSVAARFESPIGIEETFPNRNSKQKMDIDNSGQPVLMKPTSVNNDVIKPEIITGE